MSDPCKPLVALWDLVKDDPGGLIEDTSRTGRLLRRHGGADSREARQAFNESNDPHLFFHVPTETQEGPWWVGQSLPIWDEDDQAAENHRWGPVSNCYWAMPSGDSHP